MSLPYDGPIPALPAPAESQPPPVLDYLNPHTSPQRRPKPSNPWYPVAAAALSAVVGLLSHPRSEERYLAALALVPIGCWYVAARIERERTTPRTWRVLLSLVAVAAVVCAAAAAWVHYGYPLYPVYVDRWQVYDPVYPTPRDVLAIAGVFAVARAALWLLRRRKGA